MALLDISLPGFLSQACVLILARPDPCVLQQMENFQLPLRRLHEAPDSSDAFDLSWRNGPWLGVV